MKERRHRTAEHFLERLVPANFVAPHRRFRRRPAHTDEADHLIVHRDGQPARIGKFAELNGLQFRRGVLDYPFIRVLLGARAQAVRAFISAVTIFRYPWPSMRSI